MDFLETQIGLIKSLGEQAYLQLAVGSGKTD
jgi:bacterioferritin (cytochrome b1)